MALIKCKECGKEISDQATSCPNCGCPIKHNKVGIFIDEDPNITIKSTYNIYKIEGKQKILIGQCKEGENTVIDCEAPMLIQFCRTTISKKILNCNVEPNKTYRLRFRGFIFTSLYLEEVHNIVLNNNLITNNPTMNNTKNYKY